MLMQGEVTQKVTKVQPLDGIGSFSPASKSPEAASPRAIVMASPRAPIVFGDSLSPRTEEGSMTYSPHNSPPRQRPESPLGVPAYFALPKTIPQPQQQGRRGSVHDLDGAHNPRDLASPNGGQENELESILSVRKKQVCGCVLLSLSILVFVSLVFCDSIW